MILMSVLTFRPLASVPNEWGYSPDVWHSLKTDTDITKVNLLYSAPVSST